MTTEIPDRFIFDLKTTKKKITLYGASDRTGDDISHFCNAMSMTQYHAQRINAYQVKIRKVIIEFAPNYMIIDGLEYFLDTKIVSIATIVKTLISANIIHVGDYFCTSVYIRYGQFRRGVQDTEDIEWLHI